MFDLRLRQGEGPSKGGLDLRHQGRLGILYLITTKNILNLMGLCPSVPEVTYYPLSTKGSPLE